MFSWGESVVVVAALAQLAASGWLLYLRPRDATARAYALVLLFFGAFMLAQGLGLGLDRWAVSLASGPFLMAMPFASMHFAWRYLYPESANRHTWPRRTLLIVPPIALISWFVVHPADLWQPGVWNGILPPLDEDITKGPLTLAMHLFEATAGVIALLILRRALQTTQSTSNRATALVGVGFFVPAACTCAIGEFLFRLQNGWFLAGTRGGGLPPALGRIYDSLLTLQLLVVVAIVVIALRAARNNTDPTAKRTGRLVAGFTVATIALALTIGLIPPGHVQYQAIYAIWAFWNLIGVLLVLYGILKFQLFDIDLRVKAGIGHTVVAGIISATAFVGSELIEQVAGVDQLIPALLVAAVTSTAMRPLSKLGKRFANRIMPQVEDTEECRAQRAQSVYQAAYERLTEDGELDERERQALEALAENLGLEEDHARTALGR